ncbi:MAG TPA: glycoside hydrolase family 2 TIM barrel-domain containing protein [Bacteroidales bacterium]|nr:glycoside hydrolase family 2 TIM barrel-domain containing protein [Bacteroidales bacterium]
MKNKFFTVIALLFFAIKLSGAPEIQKQVIYLSGKGYQNTRTWEFFCTEGRNSGNWTKIEVPSCWEQQGFGNYEYGRNSYSFGPKYKYASEKGMYKYNFIVPAWWKGKDVNIVFDGSMTDTEVKINGKSAGEIHQGSFYRFKYDITDKIIYGANNILEVTVSKLSSDESVNRAERYGDYWNFGGIYRPVYLEAFPSAHISRVAINARADGSFAMDVFPEKITSKLVLQAEITDASGNIAGSTSASVQPGDSLLTLKIKVNNPRTWTSETPDLYTVRYSLQSRNKILYSATEKFGFRTIEVRHGDGIYLNGIKIKMKGVNRHSFWPESGRTLNYDLCLKDAKLIKEMNMNAVRCSHYPPDVDFLNICDSIGLYVLDEIAGWQRWYDTPVGKKIVKETVIRDVNHPSVIFWDNGNEGGTNKELDKEFLIYDPSKRDVIHPHHRPGNAFNGIDCNHYEPYNSVQNILNDSLIYMTTEFLHCQDDGGGGAGLYDYWELMWQSEKSAGGFLWAFIDEGLSRTDMNGYIDTDGVNAPDGVLGPHREKEGSFYAIREIFSPVHISLKELPPDFSGVIPVENRFHFTDLSKCSFTFKLVNFYKPTDWLPGYKKAEEINVTSPNAGPGEKSEIKLGLPSDWKNYDALILTARDPFKNEIYSWTWKIKNNENIIDSFVSVASENKAESAEADTSITLKANGTSVTFSKRTGKIARVVYNNRSNIMFNNGPVFTGGNSLVSQVKTFDDNNGKGVEFMYNGSFSNAKWVMHNSGWLSLDYQYDVTGPYQFAGISFSFPENYVARAKWLGDGPSRVWKNRLQGVTYNVWSKIYNNTQTGAYPFFYPEFKGYFSDFTWMELSTAQGRIYMAAADDGLFLRLYNFYGITGPKSYPELPAGDISFLDCIPPVGSKLATGLTTDASVYGPAGKPTEMTGLKKHKLWFYFGIPDISPQTP